MMPGDDDLALSGSTVLDADGTSSDDAQVHSGSDGSGSGQGESEEDVRAALAQALESGATLDDIREALLPSITQLVQDAVSGGYRATQSLFQRQINEVLRATREQREDALTQKELLRQQYGEEDFQAAAARAKQQVLAQDKELRTQALEEYYQQQQQAAQAAAQVQAQLEAQQRQGRDQQQDPNAITTDDPRWVQAATDYKAFGEEHGLDQRTVGALLPTFEELQAFRNRADPTGLIGYGKEVRKRIREAGAQQTQADRPRPRTATPRPVGSGGQSDQDLVNKAADPGEYLTSAEMVRLAAIQARGDTFPNRRR